MFGLGVTEILVILIVAFLLFGPQQLPEVGRQVGKAIKGLKDVTGDVKKTVEPELNLMHAKVDMDNLTIGGEARIRYEIRNNTSLNSSGLGNESAGSHRIRVNVGYDLTPDVSFFAQIQDARIYGSENTGTSSGIATVSSA